MKHLISNCAGKYPLCNGCAETTKQGPNGRWFITMGHAGFNHWANNRDGYVAKAAAEAISARFLSKGGAK